MYIYEKCPWCASSVQMVADWINSYYKLGYRLVSLVYADDDLYGAFEKIDIRKPEVCI